MNKPLESKNLYFRLAIPDDADFIYSLRVDEKLNKHISQVSGGASQQREWLIEYKKREELNKEFYFIICRKDNDEAIGTVRVYGVTSDKEFCWGSWVLNENKIKSAAIESALLVYKFCFEYCGFASSYFQVDKNNSAVSSFHIKTGATMKSEDDTNFHFLFSEKNYQELVKKYYKFL